MKKFTFGADPEFFLHDGTDYVAGIPFVKGTKDRPQMLPNGSNLQKDNVAVEVGVKVADSAEEFAENVLTAITDMHAVLPNHLEVQIISSANFPLKELRFEEAKEFGCEPDFNAWENGDENYMDNDCAVQSPFRSCGGHLHIGQVGKFYKFLLKPKGKVHAIQMMDVFNGVVGTIIDNNEDAIARRKLYGKAGCFRPTSYGVEYRTLSNFWCGSPVLMMLQHHLASDALESIESGKSEDLIANLGRDELIRTINEGDADTATSMWWNTIKAYASVETQELYNLCT